MNAARDYRLRLAVSPKRLWAGGVATAVVAALIAIVGIVIARGVADVAVLAPTSSGTWGDASTAEYAAVAFAAGIAATAIMHLLLVGTPSPFMLFGWITAPATAVAVALPFTIVTDLSAQVATAAINAMIGIAVWILTDSNARRSVVPIS